MDARVNDFLNEINEIAPLENKKEEPASVWDKCYDEESGYHYYWNTKTDEVTWDMPPDYKPSKLKTKRTTNLYIPPRTAPLFPSTSILLPPVVDAVKIYKIGDSPDVINKKGTEKVNINVKKESKTILQQTKSKSFKPPNSSVDSDDDE